MSIAAPAGESQVPTAASSSWRTWLMTGIRQGPIYRRRVDFFTKSRAFDIGRARRELGYAPSVGLREGIARTLAWYRAHGWL